MQIKLLKFVDILTIIMTSSHYLINILYKISNRKNVSMI